MVRFAMKSSLLGLVALLLAGLFRPVAAGEAASPWVVTDQTRLRLISARTSVADDGVLSLGLQVELAPGWKIYWRSPGDAGFPPRFDWAASRNLADMKTLWPAPKRFIVSGLQTLGFKNAVVYPLAGRAATGGEGVALRLKLEYGICEVVCIPYDAELALTLPPGRGEASDHAELIAKYRDKVPASDDVAIRAVGFDVAGVSVEGPPGRQVLVVDVKSGRPLGAPDVVIEADPGPKGFPLFYFGVPEAAPADSVNGARWRLAVDGGRRKRDLNGTGLTVTVIDGSRAMERHVTPRAVN